MKIIIAPDSFKESMTALEVAEAVETGFKRIIPEATYIKLPMADGGEGTVQSLIDATQGTLRYDFVTGPDGKIVKTSYGLNVNKKIAIIEMASASGIDLIKQDKRNPLTTTTRGTGELILKALDMGVNHIIIGIGGSATNDGGAGMAQALGVKLLDKDCCEIDPGGGNLNKLDAVDVTYLDPRLKEVKIEVACDVDNPLVGKKGASAIFGPQKGATPDMVVQLDQNLSHFSDILKRDIGKDVSQVKGSGAAGGLGAGLLAFTNAELRRGFDIVKKAVKLEEITKGASLVITGEGKMDNQIIYGKTPSGVAAIAKKYKVPVIGIAGEISEDSDTIYDADINALFSISPGPIDLKQSIVNGKMYTEKLAENIARTIKISNKL